jgi:hypothetical protein
LEPVVTSAPQKPTHPRPRRWLRRFSIAAVILGVSAGAFAWYTHRGPTPPTEIYRGITYSCIRLPDDPQAHGLVHLIRVDLTAPGIQLFTTPLDADATSRGWEYKLRWVSSAVRDEHLAVGINASMFNANSRYFPLPGDLARGVEPLVNNHAEDHPCWFCWMVGFDDDLTPHFYDDKPPTPAELARFKWGVGTQLPILLQGQLNNAWDGTTIDHRTAIGINTATKTLWLACFEQASIRYAAQFLSDQGATDAGILDGGHSTSMAVGADVAGIPSGSIISYYRPVANVFGIRAQPVGQK